MRLFAKLVILFASPATFGTFASCPTHLVMDDPYVQVFDRDVDFREQLGPTDTATFVYEIPGFKLSFDLMVSTDTQIRFAEFKYDPEALSAHTGIRNALGERAWEHDELTISEEYSERYGKLLILTPGSPGIVYRPAPPTFAVAIESGVLWITPPVIDYRVPLTNDDRTFKEKVLDVIRSGMWLVESVYVIRRGRWSLNRS